MTGQVIMDSGNPVEALLTWDDGGQAYANYKECEKQVRFMIYYEKCKQEKRDKSESEHESAAADTPNIIAECKGIYEYKDYIEHGVVKEFYNKEYRKI
jgi:hypothetical protein